MKDTKNDLEMYRSAYLRVAQILDEALGGAEDDGTGLGVAGDVYLVVRQRDLYRGVMTTALGRLARYDPVGAERLQQMAKACTAEDLVE